MAVSAQDIVDAARQLLGARYRWWYPGASLPMWYDDGYTTSPPASYIVSDPGVGCMCSDLLDFARQECGLEPLGGTEGYARNLVNITGFDVDSPGVVGAVALKPYFSPYSQGHVALYSDNGHQLLQSLVNPGVTEDFTDYETVQWPGCDFDFYGFMPDVDYTEINVTPEGDNSLDKYWTGEMWGWMMSEGREWLHFPGDEWDHSVDWSKQHWIHYRTDGRVVHYPPMS